MFSFLSDIYLEVDLLGLMIICRAGTTALSVPSVAIGQVYTLSVLSVAVGRAPALPHTPTSSVQRSQAPHLL